MSDTNSIKKEEEPDEWTVIADSYTSVLVPSFAPIYNAVADLISCKKDDDATVKKVLDFGCGPGEPSLTIANKFPSFEVVGVDSTQSMLDIAVKRVTQKPNRMNDCSRIRFHHIRRDVTMEELVKTIGCDSFDTIVSTFTMHYLDFPRRVELVSQFMKMAPDVWLVSWGDQSKVGFLRAIKTFGKFKTDTSKDICDLQVDPEDNLDVESPKGSFTLCRKEAFQGIVDQVDGSQLASFDIKSITLCFASIKNLLQFLPIPTDDNDIEAMWKLLKSWGADQVTLGDGPDQVMSFPTDVVFCHLVRGPKRCSDQDGNGASKRPKGA